MAASPLTQLTLLTRLTLIGYPADDVLRYVPGPNDTYTTQLRAIGTSVDPNVFGGTLMLSLALVVVQWASPVAVESARRAWDEARCVHPREPPPARSGWQKQKRSAFCTSPRRARGTISC